MRKCPECGKTASGDATSCPECGYPFTDGGRDRSDLTCDNDVERSDGTPAEHADSALEDERDSPSSVELKSVDDAKDDAMSKSYAAVEDAPNNERASDDEQSFDLKDSDGAKDEAAPNNKATVDDAVAEKKKEPRPAAEKEGESSPKDKLRLLLKSKKAMMAAGGILAIVAVVYVLFSTHIICLHENWEEATCDEPRHCVDCGKSEGEPLGHEWVDATCTEPQTCMRCGETKGEALGHKTKEWSTPSVNVVTAEETSTLKCEACGEIVDQKTTAVKSLIKDGKFIFSPSDFCKRLRDKAGMEAIDGGDAQLISYALVESMSNRQMCAMLSFTTMDGQTNLGDSYKYDSSCNPSPVFIVDTEKCNSAEMMVGFVMTCDPALSRSEAAEVAKALAGSVSGSNGSTEKNGITYLLAGIDERIMFRAVVS